MRIVALLAGFALLGTVPAQADVVNRTFASFEECVTQAEAAGSGQFGTFTYVCRPTADGQWMLDWDRIERTRSKEKKGRGKPA